MNFTEDLGNVPNSSEDFGSLQNPPQGSSGFGRGKKYPGAEVPDPGNERGDHMIMEEAYALFENQGERRSMRMIGEYCKTGELVCFYDSDDKRWHITRESIENKINKIKDLNARRAAIAPQSTSEHFSEPAPAQRATEDVPPIPPKSEAAHPPSEDIKKLEQEIFDLKIMNKGKDYLIDQLRQERGEFITRIEDNSYRIGQLETKLLQLEAPRSTPGNDTPQQPPPDSGTRPSELNVIHDVPLADNPNNTYEHSPQ